MYNKSKVIAAIASLNLIVCVFMIFALAYTLRSVKAVKDELTGTIHLVGQVIVEDLIKSKIVTDIDFEEVNKLKATIDALKQKDSVMSAILRESKVFKNLIKER